MPCYLIFKPLQNENHLIAASGDGSIKLWDLTLPQEFPIRAFQEHTHVLCASYRAPADGAPGGLRP